MNKLGVRKDAVERVQSQTCLNYAEREHLRRSQSKKFHEKFGSLERIIVSLYLKSQNRMGKAHREIGRAVDVYSPRK